MRRRGRPRHPDILTPREWEVLDLLRQGLTNEQIARRLEVSPATAKYHVSEILSKLGVASREEAAAWTAVERRPWWAAAAAPLTAALARLGPAAALKAAGVATAAAAVAGLALLTWGVLRTEGEADIRTYPSGDTAALFPPGFIAFAEALERAFETADTAFFRDNSLLEDYDCGGGVFPAPGPICAIVSPGEGTPAIHIGRLNSEGDVWDQPAYGLFIQDLLTNADENAFDEFGGPAPRVYALADMPPGIESDPQETYSVITSRIAGPVTNPGANVLIGGPEGERVVVIFFATSLLDGWRITSLLRVWVDFLDPYRPEPIGASAREYLLAWARWEDVTGTNPTPTPTPLSHEGWEGSPRAGRELAYVKEDGSIHVARADGSGHRLISQTPCASTGEAAAFSIQWSPPGDKFGLICWSPEGYDGTLLVYDETGKLLRAAKGPTAFRWSPDGQRAAFQIGFPPPPETSTYSVRVLDLATSAVDLVAENAVLLDWPQPDRLLLGLNLQPDPGGLSVIGRYEAAWLDLSTGETERVPRLDRGAQFWTSPDGTRAVVLAGQAERPQGGAILGVYDLTAGQETVIQGSAIGYPSEGIPRWRVAISPAGDEFYWADLADGERVYRASIDGSGLRNVADIQGNVIALSGDGLAAYWPLPTGADRSNELLFVEDMETGARTEIEDARQAAWRPTP